MQPTRSLSRIRVLHGFDARSLVLFAGLTMGGTQAIMAQSVTTPPAQQAAPSQAVQQAQAAPAAPRAAPTADQAFDRADANGDGKLTLREAERFPAVAERFQQFDVDHNGSLSREEFSNGLKQH